LMEERRVRLSHPGASAPALAACEPKGRVE
jgi:hypothetical protein